jgi:hypothetical protein
LIDAISETIDFKTSAFVTVVPAALTVIVAVADLVAVTRAEVAFESAVEAVTELV